MEEAEGGRNDAEGAFHKHRLREETPAAVMVIQFMDGASAYIFINYWMSDCQCDLPSWDRRSF